MRKSATIVESCPPCRIELKKESPCSSGCESRVVVPETAEKDAEKATVFVGNSGTGF